MRHKGDLLALCPISKETLRKTPLVVPQPSLDHSPRLAVSFFAARGRDKFLQKEADGKPAVRPTVSGSYISYFMLTYVTSKGREIPRNTGAQLRSPDRGRRPVDGIRPLASSSILPAVLAISLTTSLAAESMDKTQTTKPDYLEISARGTEKISAMVVMES